MENLTIKKTDKGKEYLYEVFNAAGEKIGQRKSPREYVAAAVYLPGAQLKREDGTIWREFKEYYVESWIGRLDLVGKNRDVAKFGASVAYLS